ACHSIEQYHGTIIAHRLQHHDLVAVGRPARHGVEIVLWVGELTHHLPGVEIAHLYHHPVVVARLDRDQHGAIGRNCGARQPVVPFADHTHLLRLAVIHLDARIVAHAPPRVVAKLIPHHTRARGRQDARIVINTGHVYPFFLAMHIDTYKLLNIAYTLLQG